MTIAAPLYGGEAPPREVRGAIAELFEALEAIEAGEHHYLHDETEILVDGGAGSGKTYGIIWLLDEICELWPGVRIAIARAHKARLTESVMASMRKALFDEKPYLFSGQDRGRESYNYKNGSKIIPTALDDEERQKSVEADIWYINEVTECQEDKYTMVLRAMRAGSAKWRFLISDANPGPKFHWVNQRCKEIAGVPNPGGKMCRLKSVIQDNPYFWDTDTDSETAEGLDYLGSKLANLQGVQYRRLVLNEWCSEEGLVWETYDEEVNLVDGRCYQPTNAEGEVIDPNWWIEVSGEMPFKVDWFFAGLDWGWENPGTMLIFAVDGDGRTTIVEEYYHTHRLIDWWAEKAADAQLKYGVSRFVCDASQPGSIFKLNQRMGSAEDRDGNWLAMPAQVMTRKAAKPGEMTTLDQVRWGFEKDGAGMPRIRILRNALQHEPDAALKARRRPTCLAEEVTAYVFEEAPVAHPEEIQEKPRKLNDHACNALEYGYTWSYQRNFAAIVNKPMFPPGSFGDLMGHEEILNPKPKPRKEWGT